MADRAKALGRVLAVQRQVVRLAEWRLAALQRQCAEIKDDQACLQAFVAGEEALTPLLSAAAFGRGQSLLQAAAERESQAQAQSVATDAARQRERLAEKLVEAVRAEARRAAEKRHLEEAVEAWARRGDASFP